MTTPKRTKTGQFAFKSKKNALAKKTNEYIERNLPPGFEGPVALLREMLTSKLFRPEKLADLYMDLFNEAFTHSRTVSGRLSSSTGLANTPKTAKDATQLVPVSNIQASSMTPNFDSMRSFFLTGHQKHPKFPDWVSAEEMGDSVGMKADNVKKYSTEYAKARGFDISNNLASQKVIDNGGYFKGLSTLVDGHGIPCYVNEEIGCVGIWFLMEDGKIVWRNYWSPSAVKTILDSIPESKKTLPQKSLNPFGNGQTVPGEILAAAETRSKELVGQPE